MRKEKRMQPETRLEIFVPEIPCRIVTSRPILQTQQFHHKAIDLNILKSIHNVRRVLYRVPAWAVFRASKQGRRALIVNILDVRRERSVRYKYGVHRRIIVIIPMILAAYEHRIAYTVSGRNVPL